MSTIRVEQAHALDLESAKRAVDVFAQDIAKYGMKLVWSGSRGELKGTGASGEVEVESSRVVVTVKLGMVAKMAGVKADKLQASIEKRLKAALAPE